MGQQDLAERIGMSKDKLSKSITGVRQFTVGEANAISHVLDVDLGWLIDGRVDRTATRTVFRHRYDPFDGSRTAPDTASRADLDVVERAWLLADVPVSDGFTGAAAVAASANPHWEDVRHCVEKVVQHWVDWCHEVTDPVADVAGFLATFGVDLVVLQFPFASRVQTYSMVIRGHRVVIVHTTAAWYSAMFGIFHELAHLLFGHDEVRTDETAPLHLDAEVVANGFAADVLMPKEDVLALEQDVAESAIAQFCWDHLVGGAALDVRCHLLKKTGIQVPPQPRINELWRENHPDWAQRRSQAFAAQRFPDWLVRRHEELVRDGVIPPDTLSIMTSTPIDDLAAPPVPAGTEFPDLSDLGL